MTSSNHTRSIAVIGGGAAGYFGAIRAAESNPSTQVIIYEATARPLTKVKISGGGRCNVTHNCFDVRKLVTHYPRGERELMGPFSRFQPKDTVQWYESRGVKIKAEEDGRMFPVTDSSETIIQCLQQSADKAGVHIKLQTSVKHVAKTAQGFVLTFKDGTEKVFDRLLLASGSSPEGHELARSLGHTIVTPCPSLFTFKIDDPRLKDLAGISFEKVDCKLTCPNHSDLKQSGPMLITHWGLSGPAVLKLSAWGARPLSECAYQAKLRINFLPGTNQDKCLEILTKAKLEHAKKLLKNLNPTGVSNRFWERLVELHSPREGMLWADIAKKDLQKIAQELTDGQYAITGKGVFKEEFVTCGGIELKEVDFKTMQSRITPGLFFAGEVLNIDGVTGGFNFQNAWTTSWIAGEAMTKDL
jgi:predicted Rossmann fold flavoprotein